MRKQAMLLLAVVLITASCSNRYYYKKGLSHAQNPMPANVYTSLTEVTPGNNHLVWKTINGKQYVLAVTWKADTTYYTAADKYDQATGMYSYNTGGRPIFVTMAPYLKEQRLGKMKDKKLNMRLNQVLGLPPNSKYSYFMEVWVRPEDLMRPCFSPSVGVNACEYKPSKDDEKNKEHMAWIYKYIYDSYQDPDMEKRYPFSHLGYTYDWSPKNVTHVGLSEFVIGTNKDVYVSRIYTTRGYFQ